MFKVSIKRYGYPVWDGHQRIHTLIGNSLPSLSDADKAKFIDDNRNFISTIKTLVSTTQIKATPSEIRAGLSWTTEYVVTNEVEANAIKEYYSIRVQERINAIDPNCGLVVHAEVTRI